MQSLTRHRVYNDLIVLHPLAWPTYATVEQITPGWSLVVAAAGGRVAQARVRTHA